MVIIGARDAKGEQMVLGWLRLGKGMGTGDLTAICNCRVGGHRDGWECVEWLHLLRSAWWKGKYSHKFEHGKFCLKNCQHSDSDQKGAQKDCETSILGGDRDSAGNDTENPALTNLALSSRLL